jgi:hypothetical protein
MANVERACAWEWLREFDDRKTAEDRRSAKLNLAVTCVAAVAGVVAAVTGTRHRGGNVTRASMELNSEERGTNPHPAAAAWRPIASGLLSDWLTGAHQPKFWCSRQKLGCFHFLGPLHTLILDLRIAYGLSQHLVQLSLGFLRFPLGRLPLCHGPYVGMPGADLNPRRDLSSAR